MKLIWVLVLLAAGTTARAIDPNNPSFQAMRSLSSISAELYLRDGPEILASVYSAANDVSRGSEQMTVCSAEKALDFYIINNRLSPKYLTTLAYLKARSSMETSYSEALKRHGSAFEICIMPVDQATNLGQFIWRTREADGSRVVCQFPLLWVKRSALYLGTRPILDVSGQNQILVEDQFSEYWQAALDWYNCSRPLKVIDQMLAQTGDTDIVLNGLMFLKRHGDREVLQDRLESLLVSTNRQVVFHAINELAAIPNERAVAAIGKMVDRSEVSREQIAQALGKTGQPGAVKHLERVLGQKLQWLAPKDKVFIRLAVAKALASIPTKEAREVLERLVGDTDPGVSAAAKRALGAEPPK